MQTITNWSATPSGGAITINGTDKATGEAVRVTGVRTIAPHKRRWGSHTEATDGRYIYRLA